MSCINFQFCISQKYYIFRRVEFCRSEGVNLLKEDDRNYTDSKYNICCNSKAVSLNPFFSRQNILGEHYIRLSIYSISICRDCECCGEEIDYIELVKIFLIHHSHQICGFFVLQYGFSLAFFLFEIFFISDDFLMRFIERLQGDIPSILTRMAYSPP